MGKHLQSLIRAFLLLLIITPAWLEMHGKTNSAGCSDAGTAAASADSVCYSTPVDLTLTGYLGTIFQWQSFDGTNWNDETGPGSNTDTYTVTLNVTKVFRAIVIETLCPPDTSNEVTVNVGTIPAPSGTPATRCGPGIVNLLGAGTGTLEWFTDASGGSLVATGSPTTAFIPSSTTLWLQDNALGGSSLSSGLQITEVNLDGDDNLEIQNVSPLTVDVTGWKVLISDSYTDINISNINIQNLNGIMQPGDILSWTDAGAAPNYWGSNMFWNPGSFPSFTGWALIVDDLDVPKDFVVWAWPAASIQSMSILVGSTVVTPGTIWSGDGIDASAATASGLSRIGTSDNDTLSDFTIAPLSLDFTNPQMTLPFTGFGCTSPRIPVQVTITPSDSISINASATTFCQSGSSTLTAVSSNAGYSYTWSPATGLDTTMGATVISTPPGPGNYTYIVTGDDGTCSNVDTVTISVGIPTVAGVASTFQDTICLGKTAELILAGSSGFIQWQSLAGSNWVDETGPGSDSPAYTVAPVTNTTYRAYVYSGSCPPDSSNLINIVVVSILDPVTTNDSVCGGGSMTLLAAGAGILNWYNVLIGGNPINTGGSHTFSATQTTTFYVEAFAGSEYHIGPLTSSFGTQTATVSNDFGLAFDVIRPVTIDVVYVYPTQSGTVTINLRETAGGPILATYSQAVTGGSGKTVIPVGFSVPVGTGYRMEVASGGPTMTQNNSGATYPYTAANSPLTITGYYNPNYNTGGVYLWMYDWIVSEGCRSNRIPVSGVVNSFPAIPTITQNFNVLTSSSASGNQWFLNGSPIPGATDQVLTITQTGNYLVAVTINGCTTNSSVFQVLSIGLNEIPEGIFNLYPNPANDMLYITITDMNHKFERLNITDVTGRMVYSLELQKVMSTNAIPVQVTNLPNGIYILELQSTSSVSRTQFVVER